MAPLGCSFRAVAAWPYGIIKIVITSNISAAHFRVNIAIRLYNSRLHISNNVILYEDELVTSPVRRLGPRSIALGAISPGIVPNLQRGTTSSTIDHAVINHPVEPPVRMYLVRLVQLFEVTVVNSDRKAFPRQADGTVISLRTGCSRAEGESSQTE